MRKSGEIEGGVILLFAVFGMLLWLWVVPNQCCILFGSVGDGLQSFVKAVAYVFGSLVFLFLLLFLALVGYRLFRPAV